MVTFEADGGFGVLSLTGVPTVAVPIPPILFQNRLPWTAPLFLSCFRQARMAVWSEEMCVSPMVVAWIAKNVGIIGGHRRGGKQGHTQQGGKSGRTGYHFETP